MIHARPIIGVAGGIGSGKSFVADLFAELGAKVIRSDDLVRDAYRTAEVKDALRRRWGESVFDADGAIDRRAVAAIVFERPDERRALEALLHPIVIRMRAEAMDAASSDANVAAFVWDTPLLFESDLHQQCDAIVFVDAPADVRLARVRGRRGWDEAELRRRENAQWPLDRKRGLSDDVVVNTTDAEDARRQVKEIFPRILARLRTLPTPVL